jgi:predicted ATP-dependent serine protease
MRQNGADGIAGLRGSVGGEQELRAIDGLFDGIRDQGGSMLVRGEAGLGKSALLQEAEARATARGIAVLRTAGAASEKQMAFSGLHQPSRHAKHPTRPDNA